jgi:hypothetical protein
MSQLPPVILPGDTWVDIYAETGISVGTKLIIHNNSNNDAILADTATKPDKGYGFDIIQPYEYLVSADTPSGVWARSDRKVTLQVREA